MKNIIEILKESNIELTKEQESSITKLVNENYKTIAEFDKQKTLVMARLSETGMRTIETPLCKATITQGGTARSFDTARFKAENPELYDRYISERETKPSLRLTLV